MKNHENFEESWRRRQKNGGMSYGGHGGLVLSWRCAYDRLEIMGCMAGQSISGYGTRDMPPMQYTNPLSIGELEAMIPGSWPLDHALDVLGKPSTHRSTARGSTIFYELEKAPRQGCSSNLVFSFALYFTNGILCNWWPIVVGEGCDSDCAEEPGDGP